MGSLGPGDVPVVRPHYKHMMAEDVAVWSKFLLDPPVKIERVWYDLRVGAPVKLPDGASALERRIAEGTTRKRIDAVARTPMGVWVVEVKPFGSMMAVGQALIYSRLFVREYEVPGDVWAAVVCDRVDEDVVPAAQELAVLMVACGGDGGS